MAARRHRFILNLIDHLPASSHYVAAIADDEEAAALVDPADKKPAAPPLTDFGPEVRALAQIHDRLGVLVQAVTASSGAKAPKMQPYPRPRTALDRARTRRRWARHDDIVSRVLRR